MMKYETVIGIETHVELKTKTKIFCSCSAEFGGEPNSKTCPICAGFPGSLPVVNEKILEYAIRAGLALNCHIQKLNIFDRKSYFYPDLGKGYQISQLKYPIALNGYLDIEVDGKTKRVNINRIHMEEDAGKLIHTSSTISSSESSIVDYNRSSVPLLEIVTEPDISSPKEARAYMEKLRTILQYIDVSDCKMQEGSLRCDANVSVRPFGQKEYGVRSEVKNLNSFKAVQRSLEYEELRKARELEEGVRQIQDTRTWDEEKGLTISMRSKEQADDYRYFQDPDIPPIILDKAWIEDVANKLPELPDARKKRLMQELGLSEYDALGIVADIHMANYFDETLKYTKDAKAISNWLLGDILAWLNNNDVEDIRAFPVEEKNIAQMIELVNEGIISSKLAKTVFEELTKTSKSPQEIIKEKGLEQISDTNQLLDIVQDVINNNPQSVGDYLAGKERAIEFLVGQIMKETKGKANPEIINKLLKEKMS